MKDDFDFLDSDAAPAPAATRPPIVLDPSSRTSQDDFLAALTDPAQQDRDVVLAPSTKRKTNEVSLEEARTPPALVYRDDHTVCACSHFAGHHGYLDGDCLVAGCPCASFTTIGASTSPPAPPRGASRETEAAAEGSSPTAAREVSSRGEVIPPPDLQDPGTPAAQLRSRWWKLKEDRIRVDGPGMTTRTSAIGEECERKLFYARTVPAKDRVKHGPGLQAIFDLGNNVERYVVRELEDMGCEIVQRGRDYLDRERELSAHTDVRVRLPGWKKALVAEIKGLNPFVAGNIETIADVRDHRQAWIRKYYAQLQGYLGLDALGRLLDDDAPQDALELYLEDGLFVLLNKSTGTITFIDCPADLEFILGLLRKAERIRDAVRAGVAPDRHVSDDCDRCPFNLVCAPPRSFGPGAQFLSEELAGLLERRSELAQGHRDYEAADAEAKALIPKAVGEYVAGQFVIRVTERSRKATAATTYVNREIKKVGG